MPLATGTTFADFTIVRLLGSGRVGDVYVAQREGQPEQVALKILTAELSDAPGFTDRFLRDAEIATTLWHRNIVVVGDRGEFDGRLWISSDYVDGTSARQLLADHPAGLPLNQVLAIVDAVAAALDYAHGRGLLHGDVRPGNIMLTDSESPAEQRILLRDFGIPHTAGGPAAATAAYSAPETLAGADVGGRADQYALAATAYHLLAGEELFGHADDAAVIEKHLNSPAPRLGKTHPELAGLDAALEIALAKDPADRFGRCSDFARALREQVARTAVALPPPPGQSLLRDRPRRNKLLRRLVAVIALLASIGIAIAIIGGFLTQLFGGGAARQKPAQATVTTRTWTPPPENIRPLQVRPVQEMRTPDECPPEGQVPAAPPTDPLTTCDFTRTATYVLGPQVMDVRLTHVETLKSPTSEFHVVRITMDKASAAMFGAYTQQHVGSQLAFVRDNVVVFAPKITQPITSEGLEISGNLTAEQANGMAALLRKPA